MKGTVVGTWVKTLQKLYPEYVYNNMKKAGINPDAAISPFDNIDDNKVNDFIKFMADDLKITVGKLWRMIGKDNVKSFYISYALFFNKDNLYHFLDSMNNVHKIVRKKIPGSNPPLLDIKIISGNSIYFTYSSKRNMYDYLLGLLDGACEHFKEEVVIEEIERDNGFLKLKMTFPYKVKITRRYYLNQILSLGFIKSFGIKLAMLTSLLSFLGNFLLGKLPIVSEHPALFYSGQTVVIGFLSYILLTIPFFRLKKEVKSIMDKDFIVSSEIRTGGDFIEQINRSVVELKNLVSEDLIEFSSMTEELQSFGSDLNKIAGNMDGNSKGISSVVGQLENSSHLQAVQAEKIVEILHGNLEGLTNLSEEENKNKIELESILSDINTSFEGLNSTVESMKEIMQSFEDLKNKSSQISIRGREIEKVAKFVSDISFQTNLLSLNASVEAARAGAAGKGFNVVAGEVRMLSDQSAGAAEEIKENIFGFLKEIEMIAENISEQYDNVEKQSELIQNSVSQTLVTNQRLESIGEKMLHSVEELKLQTEKINQVFDFIQAQAASSEENSAATQIVGTNVNGFINELKELTEGIKQFSTLTAEFREYIQAYKI